MYAAHGSPSVTGLPGSAVSIGLPVCGSTLAAMAFSMGATRFQAFSEPDGINEGPKRAPTSPPDTAVVKNWNLSAYFCSRATESVHKLLPVSITTSSGESPAVINCSQTASTASPAGMDSKITAGEVNESSIASKAETGIMRAGCSPRSFSSCFTIASTRPASRSKQATRYP